MLAFINFVNVLDCTYNFLLIKYYKTKYQFRYDA